MSNFVVAEVAATALAPQRLMGAVTESKDGTVTIEFKMPGMVKTTQRTFQAAELVAYMTGAAGFVIAMTNDPVAKFSGQLINKNGQTYVKSEAGVVKVNSVPGAFVKMTNVEEGSKEARAADRAAKVKVRGVGRRAAGAAAEGKTSRKAKKAAAAEDAPKKKKKKRRAE